MSETTQQRTASVAWMIVLLLMPVALLNYLDRQMLASMKTSVMESIPSFALSENPGERWGFMLGLFKWVYAACSIIGGYVADRFSRRLTICISLFVWSAVTLWTGMVHTYVELLLARSLMGISEAFYIPAALALIADHHSSGTRSRAVGLHQMAIYMGVITGGFGGYVAESESLGWRSAFLFCGIIGMAYAFPLVFALRDRSSSAQSAAKPEYDTRRSDRPGPLAAWSELLLNGSFLLLVLYFTLPAVAGWVVRDWMPAILKEKFRIGEGLAGVSASLYWQLAAMIGVTVGGLTADRWMKTNNRGRIYVSAFGMALMLVIVGIGSAATLQTAVIILIIFGLGWGLFDGNNMPILSQIVRPQLRATGYGIMNFASISCGGLADWGFGYMRDHHVSLNVIFGIFAALGIISIVLVLLIRPRDVENSESAAT
ncbi:MAG: MFS transporter [Pirellulales bacterium]